MTRTSYHTVTPAGTIVCTFEELAHAIEWTESRLHVVPGMSVRRVETRTTETTVWPEPAKLRAVA
jgi:hypothetical protein